MAHQYLDYEGLNFFKTVEHAYNREHYTNKVDSIVIDGVMQTISGKTAILDMSQYVKKDAIPSAVTFKGSVASFASLPGDAKVGDVWNISLAGGTDMFGTPIKAGGDVVRIEGGWNCYGGSEDLSGFVQKVEGKGLSTEDFTTQEKTALGAMMAGGLCTAVPLPRIRAMFEG